MEKGGGHWEVEGDIGPWYVGGIGLWRRAPRPLGHECGGGGGGGGGVLITGGNLTVTTVSADHKLHGDIAPLILWSLSGGTAEQTDAHYPLLQCLTPWSEH